MSLRYDSTSGNTAPKTPILSSILNAAGWLTIVATVFLLIAAVQTYREAATSGNLTAAALVGAAGIFGSLVFFGIAQVLNYFAIIAFHASNEKSEPILRSLHKIEGHVEAIREGPKNSPPTK